MESNRRKLASSLGFSLRLSRRLKEQQVVDHLSSALYALTAEYSVRDDAVAPFLLPGSSEIRLYGAIMVSEQRTLPQSTQTEANIITEVQCRTLMDDVMSQVRVQFARAEELAKQQDALIQKLQSEVYHLEEALQSDKYCNPPPSSVPDKPVGWHSDRADTCCSFSSRETLPLERLREQHYQRRREAKSRRRAERQAQDEWRDRATQPEDDAEGQDA